MGEVGEAYGAVRSRITQMVGSRSECATLPVPACPAWTVHDVIAHLSGVIDDILAGRLDGVATDPWTEAQVVARKDASVREMLADWGEKAPQVEAMVDGFGGPGRQLVADVVTHEHDLRGALETPGAHESDAVDIGLDFVAPGFVASASRLGLPAVEVRATDGRRWSSGDGPAEVTLIAGPYDLLRSFTGRRSPAQIGKLDWSGPWDSYLPAFAFGPFTVPEADVPD